jgi:hypothetical protein
LFPSLVISSSMLSLLGRTQNGVAKNTTINIPNRQSLIIKMPL